MCASAGQGKEKSREGGKEKVEESSLFKREGRLIREKKGKKGCTGDNSLLFFNCGATKEGV